MAKRPQRKPSQHDIESEGLPSASGFDAEFRCPGKRALCKKLPKEEDTAVTLRGQRIHKALETNDFSDLADSEGRTASRIAYGESEIVGEYGFEGAEITFEERIWDFDEEFNKIWSGRIDRYDWQPDKRRLLVIDDKSGWIIPPPIHVNWQVRSEAALLSEEHDALETVVALIHPHHPDSLWEAKLYNGEQMKHLLDVVRENVATIVKPHQQRIPGSIQCQWCTAKGICPEFKANQATLDKKVAAWIEDEGFTEIIDQNKDERGATVTALKQRVKNIETILKQYTSLAVKDPDAVAGWRLTRKLTRALTNEVQAMDLVREEFGPDALYASLTFSLASLETELAKKTTLKEAKAAVERVLSPLIKFKRGNPYLTEARVL